jgi:hypothetical protein
MFQRTNATATRYSQLSTTLLNRQLRYLIIALIIRHIQPILLRNPLAQKPPTNKMPFPLKELGTWFWSRQANEIIWHKAVTNFTFSLWSAFDIPGRGSVDSEDGLRRLLHGTDDGVERRFNWEADAEAEDRVDDKVSGGEGRGKVGSEWDREGLELGYETRKKVGGGLFRVVDCGGVAVVVEVASTDKSIAA